MPLRYAGRIVRALGTEGDVLLGDCITNFQGFEEGTSVRLGYSSTITRPYTVRRCTPHSSGRFAVLLASLSTPEEAVKLKEMGVFADEALLRTRTNNAYFDDEIVGCSVFDCDTGDKLGEVQEIWNMPANDVWAVEYKGKELPVPVIDDIVKRVDIAARRIEIYVMPGLLELVEPASAGNDNDNDDDD